MEAVVICLIAISAGLSIFSTYAVFDLQARIDALVRLNKIDFRIMTSQSDNTRSIIDVVNCHTNTINLLIQRIESLEKSIKNDSDSADWWKNQ